VDIIWDDDGYTDAVIRNQQQKRSTHGTTPSTWYKYSTVIDLEIQLASAPPPPGATTRYSTSTASRESNSIADRKKNDRECTRKTYGAQVRDRVLASLGLKTGGDPFRRNGPK
jgi:hypothetical protein